MMISLNIEKIEFPVNHFIFGFLLKLMII
jgi:hypothetical protein